MAVSNCLLGYKCPYKSYIDKETEEVLKFEINKDICDPDDLLE